MNTHDIKRYAVSGDIAYPIHEDPEGDYVTYEDHVAAIEADRKRGGEPVELQGVAEAISNGDGFWRSCTGCHETNEGYDTGPYSKTLRCHLGNGCRECGGMGAVWDDTDYDAMADYMARGMGSPQPDEPVKPEADHLNLDRLADYISDNWPDKKYGLEEICQRLHATWPTAFMPAEPEKVPSDDDLLALIREHAFRQYEFDDLLSFARALLAHYTATKEQP